MRSLPFSHYSSSAANWARLALAAGAVAGLAVLGACTDSKPITAPPSPRNSTIQSGGLANATKVTVCVATGSPAGTYMFTNSGFLSPYEIGVAPLVIDGADGGMGPGLNGNTTENVPDGTAYPVAVGPGGCVNVLTRTAPDDGQVGSPECPNIGDPGCTLFYSDTWSGITVTASTNSAAAVYDSTSCTLDQGVLLPLPNPCGSGNNPTRAYANMEHGAVLTFFFKAAPPPPAACVSLDTYYPYGALPNKTATVFNESGALSAWARSGNQIRAWYTDEHALTLGVDSFFINRKAPKVDLSGAYSIASMGGLNPSSATGNPINIGSTVSSGILAAFDGAGRPLHPALFVTDITGLTPASTKHDSTAGDWQIAGGTGIAPNAIYGSWKGAVINVDSTKNPPTKTLTPRADPAQNHKNVGAGGVNPPALVPDLGYSAEIVWDVTQIPFYDHTHTYRLQFMVHDGDQNKTGGDVGQACLNVGPGTPANFGPIIH